MFYEGNNQTKSNLLNHLDVEEYKKEIKNGIEAIDSKKIAIS